jgi:hypothetical protein
MKQLSLELFVEALDDGPSPSWVGGQLVKLGGQLVSWQPETSRYPARAVFTFASEEERQKFATSVRHMPGVIARNYS